MEKLVSHNWTIDDPYSYGITVFLIDLGIRVGLSLLRAPKQAHEADRTFRTFCAMFWKNLRGFHPKESGATSDYGHPFIIGAVELASYPILFATGAWIVIGAWIGLKTIAQWNVWTQDRAIFNLFLIGNLAVVITALLILTPQITVN